MDYKEIEQTTNIDSNTYISDNSVKKSYVLDSVNYYTNPSNVITFYDSVIYNNSEQGIYVKSIFSNHKLNTKEFKPIVSNSNNTNWLFAVVFSATLLFIYLQVNFYNRFHQIIRAFYITRYYGQLTRDGNILKERIIFPIYGLYSISVALLIFCLFDNYFDVSYFSVEKPYIFLIIFGCFIIINIFRLSITRFTGLIFENQNDTYTHLTNHLLYSFLVGIGLLPFLILFIYSKTPVFLVVAVLIISGLYISRLIKAIITWRKSLNIFKLILYLCTIEIIPNIILLKAIINLSNSL